MKKIGILFLMFMLFTLVGCQGLLDKTYYTDDEPIVVSMSGDSLKILQLTDLHFHNRFDPEDLLTLNTISALVQSDTWDLVVITGDLTLSGSAPAQFTRLVNHMESLGVPWTFVFGNHETDSHSYDAFLDRLDGQEHLLFKVGPDLGDGACGVFRILFTHAGVPFYTLYFLDSHPEDEEGRHSAISTEQVAWYESHVAEDETDSLAFTHIPLKQFEGAVDYLGVFEEKRVYSQEEETGFFDAMVASGKTVGFFCGHDHLNDFLFYREGICLAYGRITGHNDYGDLEKGGRVIEINASAEMTTYVLLEKELG